MILGYNTNGLAHHHLIDAVELLAEIGYRGIALTIDHGALNPYSHGYDSQLEKLTALASEYGLTWVVETGARYLLDSRQKHEPTLVSPDPQARKRRVEFLKRAIDTAKLLDARCVSLWSGVVRDGAPRAEAFVRLVNGLNEVIDHASLKGVRLGFEPEPGMLVETLEDYSHLLMLLSRPHGFDLTLDIGHLHCNGEIPIAEKLSDWADYLVNIHIEDMRAGVHEHLMFGEGEIDFPPVIAALESIGYDGVVGVELSRHSHDGPNAARKSFEYLTDLISRRGASSFDHHA